MAEQELKKISQEELDKILEQHKLWVTSKGQDGIRADLSFHDLRELEFPIRVNLKKANLMGAILWRANLEGANLEGAILWRANLEGANLDGAILEGAILEGANLDGAILWRANLDGAILEGASLEGASLEGASLEGASLEGANLEGAWGVSHHIRLTINTNLEEQTIQQQFKINQLEQELQKAKAENNQSQEQQEKITQLEQALQQAKQDKQELEQLKQISNAHGALTNSLTNTETQIENNQEFSKLLGQSALWLIALDITYIVIMPFIMVYTKFYDFMANKVGMWGILFLTFPALLILLIALALLRHQKQLIAEIRHYSMLKHKIELYGGILKAAQYIAFAQNSKEDNYIKETFNEIKVELLKSPNFDLNAQPHIFPEEGGNLLEMFKSTTELLKISTETSKAAAEIVKKTTTSEKSNL